MNLALPLAFIFIGLILLIDPELAYRYNIKMVEIYARIVNKIPILSIMAKESLRANRSLKIGSFREFGAFIVIIGSILLLVILFQS